MGDFKKYFEKNIGKVYSSILSFMIAFVVSSCGKNGFRVLLSLSYGTGLFLIAVTVHMLIPATVFTGKVLTSSF